MDKIDLANRIFNSQNHEDRSNGERPISSFKSATATSDSEDGYVTVVFDERNVQTDAYGAGVKLPTIGNVTKGQQVLVASVEKNGISTLTVLGSNGSGDAVATAANTAQHMAMTAEESMAFVKQMAQSADKKADKALSHSAVAGKTYEGICTTSTPVAEKTLTVDKSFTLVNGTTVIIGFKYGNSAVNPTLNVNNTGAKPIMTNGMPYVYCANETRTLLLYDGTNWQNCGMQLYGDSLLLGDPKSQNMHLTKNGFQLRSGNDPYVEISESGLSLPTYTIQHNNNETTRYTSTAASDVVDLNNESFGLSRWFEKRYDIMGSTEISFLVPQLNRGQLFMNLPLDNYSIQGASVEALAPYMKWGKPVSTDKGRSIVLTWTLTPRSNLAQQGAFATDIINSKIDFIDAYSIRLSIIGYSFEGNHRTKWFAFQNTKIQTSLSWLTSMTGKPPGSSEKKEFFLKGPQTIDIDTLQKLYPNNSLANNFICTFKPYQLMSELNLLSSFITITMGTVTPEQQNALMQYSSSFFQAFIPNVKEVTSVALSANATQTMIKNGPSHIVNSVIGDDVLPQYTIEVGRVDPEEKKPNDYYEGEHGYSNDEQEEHLALHIDPKTGFVISSRIKNMDHPTNFFSPLRTRVPIRSNIIEIGAKSGVSFFGRRFLRNVPPYTLLWYNANNVTDIVNGQCRYPIGAYHLIALVCCGSNEGAATELGDQHVWTILMIGAPTGAAQDMVQPFSIFDNYNQAGELHCSSSAGNGNFYSASLKYDGYQWTYDIAKVYHWGTWKSEKLQIQKIYGLL